MSTPEEKANERSTGGRARARLNIKCKNAGSGTRCNGLECGRWYRVEESDAQGPLVISIQPMIERTIWRRIQKVEPGIFLFELVGENLPLPLE